MRKLSPGVWENTECLLRTAEVLAEMIALTVAFSVVFREVYGIVPVSSRRSIPLSGFYGLLLTLVFQNTDCTVFGQRSGWEMVSRQMAPLGLVNFITYGLLCILTERVLAPGPMALLTVLDVLLAGALVSLYTWLHRRLYPSHRLLLVYGDNRGAEWALKMESRQERYCISRRICAETGWEAIRSRIAGQDGVLLAEVPEQLRNEILKYCYAHQIRTYLAPALPDILVREATCIPLFDTPLLLVKGTGLSFAQRAAKRTMDILLSLAALAVTAPVLLAVAAAIKLEDGGPVFFRQKRLTRGGREFTILKFRSMVVDAERFSGAVLAAREDPRVTRVGSFLRRTHLDEFPQFFNILAGDMSLVGPRPERKIFADAYSEEIPEFPCRLKVRGGLTGYAQVYGRYDTSAYNKLRMDLMYIEQYSLWLDIKLLLMTIQTLFGGNGSGGGEGVSKREEEE